MIFKSCHQEIRKLRRDEEFVIALAGNPNVGKSTLFNQWTGLSAVTAHYPGKTVSLNLGPARYKGISFGVIDLPGVYALGSLSDDQWIARREIIEGSADVIAVLIDATNLERNLYLALQIMSLGFPVVIACNLMDLAEKKRICIDFKGFSRLLGIPVIPVIARTGKGIKDLKNFYCSRCPSSF